MKVRKIACDLAASPLCDVDFADSYALSIGKPMTARDAAFVALGRMPPWVRGLMALRNLIVLPLGLKHDSRQFADQTAFVGAFPVVSETPGRVVLGFDDRHLDFRVTIDVRRAKGDGMSAATEVVASTWVRTHNRLGRVYLACVMPFHNLIVPTALRQLRPQ